MLCCLSMIIVSSIVSKVTLSYHLVNLIRNEDCYKSQNFLFEVSFTKLYNNSKA